MFKKIIASLMAALMAALTLANPALAAVAVKDYPNFLGDIGDFYVVVGATGLYPAATIDVVGAVDIAANLAQLSTVPMNVPGTYVDVAGKSDEIAVGDAINNATYFGPTLSWRQLPQLKSDTVTFLGNDYKYDEQLTVPASTIDIENSDPDDADAFVYLDNPADSGTTIAYTLTFRKDFEDDLSADDPLEMTMLGTEFTILDITTTSFTALVGTKAALTEIGSSITVEGKTITLVAAKDGEWASLSIDGTSKTINEGDTASVGAFKVTVTRVMVAEEPEHLVIVELVAGETTQETYEAGDDFPGSDEWVFGTISFAESTANTIELGDYIEVEYDPDEPEVLQPGDAVSLPGDTLELTFVGTTATAYADISVSHFREISVYEAGDTDTKILEGYAMKLTSTEDGVFSYPTSVDVYDELYLVRNSSDSWLVAAYDEIAGKYVNADPSDTKVFEALPFATDITVIYGEGTATINLDIDSADDYVLTVTAGGVDVEADFQFSSSRFILGSTKADAEATDIIVDSINEGTTEHTVMTSYGLIVQGVESEADTDRLTVSLPNVDGIEGTVAIGKVGSTEVGGTYDKMVPITTAVAKLDSEVESMKTTKNLVLVGGPCVNKLAQEIVDADSTLADYTCSGGTPGAAWTADTGYIMVLDGPFATGKTVVMVAGTEGPDTRVASQVLQQWETKLSGVTSNIAKVTTSTATAIAVE